MKNPTNLAHNPIAIILAITCALVVLGGAYAFIQSKVVAPQQQAAYVAAMKQVKAEEDLAVKKELATLHQQYDDNHNVEEKRVLSSIIMEKAKK